MKLDLPTPFSPIAIVCARRSSIAICCDAALVLALRMLTAKTLRRRCGMKRNLSRR
ncbi:hypothetical protein D3C87_2001350 [compost metagenome]